MAGHRLGQEAKAGGPPFVMKAEPIPEGLGRLPDQGQVGGAECREGIQQCRKGWARQVRPGILVVADESRRFLSEDEAGPKRECDLRIPEIAEQLSD
jgi:hypothetical protein